MAPLMICLPLLTLLGTAAPEPGDVVFETDFATAAERESWSTHPMARWEAQDDGRMALRVTVPADQAAGGHMIGLPLDLSAYRGYRLLFDCQARAEQVTEPPHSYLGVKYMLHYKAPSGEAWTNQNGVHGTFDWRRLRFSAQLPDDVGPADLTLGLQDSAGTVWFTDLKVTVLRRPLPPRPAPPLNPPPAYTGHTLPRLRGVMSPSSFRDEDLRVLGQEWNANVIRWQITRNWGKTGTDQDLADWDAWFEGKLDELDEALVACEKYGLLVVIDMHWPPGGRNADREPLIFHQQRYQDHWLAWWEKIAARYKDHPRVWGYDLVNEPVQNVPPEEAGVPDYLEAQERVARAIRAIDPVKTIFIEANGWDSPPAFRELRPVDVSNVVYQVHMYMPGQFTHQGVGGRETGIVYPGLIEREEWNADRLRRALAPVREFQLAYNVHIFCGEFSAARWAPGGAQYLADCIALFEEYGWDWTYHAWREWDGWSLEHGPDPANRERSPELTDRGEVVRGWFARNLKP